MIQKIFKKACLSGRQVHGFSPVELVIMVGFGALVAGALIFMANTPQQMADAQPVNVNVKVDGASRTPSAQAYQVQIEEDIDDEYDEILYGGLNQEQCDLSQAYVADAGIDPSLVRCIKHRKNIKLLVHLTESCREAGDTANVDACPGKPSGLGNIRNAINELNDVYGLTIGKDYKIKVIVMARAGGLVLKADKSAWGNPYQSTVQGLIDDGVEFYLCTNTLKGMSGGGKLVLTGDEKPADAVMDDIKYVTTGVSAVADYQKMGWTYFKP